jgi:anti-anti-sigma regulatory factor
MLRITVHDSPRVLTFQLEGRMAGPWVRELEECWQDTVARRCDSAVRVDLTGVTFVDDAGRACLAAMYRQGAEFVAADCLTIGIVAEITSQWRRSRGPRRGTEPGWEKGDNSRDEGNGDHG